MTPKPASKSIKISETLTVLVYACSVILSIAATLLLSSLFFHYDLHEINPWHIATIITLFICFFLLSYYSGKKIYRKGKDGFYTVSVSLLLSITVPAVILELSAGRSIPPWPAIELHGVAPEIGKTGWGRIQSLNPEAIGNNSWGQRDRERAIQPPVGKTRIAFIGDSLLEESSLIPVPLLVEATLPPSFDIVNLGISATNPVNYYWVLKNVALELGVEHVYVFMFMGNDLLEEPPENDRSIIANTILAPPPQGSLLGTLMPATNYHLTKKHKKSTNAWLGRNLHQYEQSQLALFKRVGLDLLPKLLARYDTPPGGRECQEKLSALDLRDLHQMLAHPDMNLFRTYILVKAVTEFCHPDKTAVDTPSIDAGSYSLKMIKLMRDLSLDKGVGFSVVIVPQGFDVDDRMWSQWKMLADFREMHTYSTRASRFKKTLLENNIHVVDLYPVFEGQRGTYLNVDGHWSGLGNELAAKALVPQIMKLEINQGISD